MILIGNSIRPSGVFFDDTIEFVYDKDNVYPMFIRGTLIKKCNCLNSFSTIDVACANGHLDCLKQAHKSGKPPNEQAMLLAARNGSLDCLIYCHENGFPAHKDLAYEAMFHRKINCLEYILEKYIDSVKYPFLVSFAASLCDLYCLKLLHKYGYEWDKGSSVYLKMTQNNIPCLKFIYYMYREKITNEDVSECIQPKIDEWKSLVDIVKVQMDGVPADIWNIIYTYW